MRISTCNVNGIRAAIGKGMPLWLTQTRPDVLLLQEVRAPSELVVDLIGPGYQVFSLPCEIKGRAGVAVAVREGIEVGELREGLNSCEAEQPAATGRWLEVDLPEENLTVISAYLFSGDAKVKAKMAEKYAHLDAVTTRLRELRSGAAPSTHILVAGDFNIVHTEADITNWKSNHNRTSGVLDDEIAYLDIWLGELGYVDVQRALSPDTPGPYTWWSQRGQAFVKDVGWRIDYQMVTPELADLAREFEISRASSYEERFSDHAPLSVDYALESV